jgi:hypothetical protein
MTSSSSTNSSSNDIDDEDDANAEIMAQADRCWDGNWSFSGPGGMFVDFDSKESSLEKQEWEEFLKEQQHKSVRVEDELFINLDIPGDDQESWARLHAQSYTPTTLTLPLSYTALNHSRRRRLPSGPFSNRIWYL